VTKVSPFKTSVRDWLNGDLLLLAKPAVWTDLLTELTQGSSATREMVYRKAVPAIALSITTLTLWRWNGALTLALFLSGGGSFVLHRVLQQKKQIPWHTVRQWLNSPQAPLTLSVGAGVALLVVSYSALAIGQDLNSPWLALMLLTQEMGIALVLGLAVWLMLSRQNNPVHSFERCVAGMLHRDELRRLMAVRQLMDLAVRDELSSKERSHAVDYLQLLARKETEPLVNQAIQEGLAILAPKSSPQPQLSAQSSISARRLQQPARSSVRQKTMADVG
jgi:hypothetical protein